MEGNKIKMAIISIVIVVVAVFGAIAYYSTNTEQTDIENSNQCPCDNLVLSAELEKYNYSENESINLTFTLTNNGSKPIRIDDMGLEYGNMDILINTPNSINLSYQGPWANCVPPMIVLQPHESINHTYCLNKHYVKNGTVYMFYSFGNKSLNISYFNFTLIGNYAIHATYTSKIDNNSFSLKSNVLNFRISGEKTRGISYSSPRNMGYDAVTSPSLLYATGTFYRWSADCHILYCGDMDMEKEK